MAVIPISSSEKCFDSEGNRVEGSIELGCPLTQEEAERILANYYAKSVRPKKKQKTVLPIGLDE